MKIGCPVVGINDSGGARIQEGVVSLGLYGDIFYRNVMASGVVPQISLIMGPCAGGAVYSPAITDFTVMVDQKSYMFITGPDVIKTVTGEDVTQEDLGGAPHPQHQVRQRPLPGRRRGGRDRLRQGAAVLPAEQQPRGPAVVRRADVRPLEVTDEDRELDTFVPDSANQPYDMHTVIEHVLDDGEFLEVQALFAPNIIVGFGRVEGRSVGVVANQPMQFAGHARHRRVGEGRAVRAHLRRVQRAGAHLRRRPRLPARHRRRSGTASSAAAPSSSTPTPRRPCPKVTVITRKAYGGAYDVMGSKHLGADINLAWPTAQIAVMGAQGAVNILYRRELADAGDEAEATRKELRRGVRGHLANPYIAAERGYVDSVIPPSYTRTYVVRALRALRTKRQTLPPKKHGNIPL